MTEAGRIFGNPGGSAPVGRESVSEILKRNGSGADFGTMLKEQLEKNAGERRESIQFSKHAIARADQRGIELTDGLLDSLNNAVEKARAKGAKEVVIIDARQAFIVNVPNNMVVTAISEPEMKENVFTNIDSAVII